MATAALLPHLKLPPNRLVQVLELIRAQGPERSRVAAAVVGLFGGRAEKSVFRGMALPAVTRLHLARTSRTSVWLAPNGEGVFQLGSRGLGLIGLGIRRLALDQFAMTLPMLGSPNVFARKLQAGTKSEAERGKRFRGYLVQFPYRAKEIKGFTRLPDRDLRLNVREAEFREMLVAASLPPNTLLQLDHVRSALLRQAWNNGWLATSFDVNEWLIADAQGQQPAIQLWKKTERSMDEIYYGTTSYGGVSIQEGR